ncbi:crossover junction endodeoxyribonuclease RuvC [Oerskovia sp. M15]
MDLRLLTISQRLDAWMDEHVPDVVAVERVFAQHNVSTVMGTAQVAGSRWSLPPGAVSPSRCTPQRGQGRGDRDGRADKVQVQRMVARILGLTELPKPADAADALALAICHLWRPPALQGGDHHQLTPAQRRGPRPSRPRAAHAAETARPGARGPTARLTRHRASRC